MTSSFQVDQPQIPVPRVGTEHDSGPETATAHEKAAMLAEFNGTYELAQWHREQAERLRREERDTAS